MVIATVAAGTFAAKAIKGSLIVAVVNTGRATAMVAADVAIDPPGGFGDIVSTAAQEGLAFSLAVLFVALLITRKIKVVDPDERSAIEEMQKDVNSSKNKIEMLDRTIEQQSKQIDVIVELVKSSNRKIEAIHEDIK